ncbi:MAG: hypothetical protein AAFR04_13490 [Pseudomonadota bacterium]
MVDASAVSERSLFELDGFTLFSASPVAAGTWTMADGDGADFTDAGDEVVVVDEASGAAAGARVVRLDGSAVAASGATVNAGDEASMRTSLARLRTALEQELTAGSTDYRLLLDLERSDLPGRDACLSELLERLGCDRRYQALLKLDEALEALPA